VDEETDGCTEGNTVFGTGLDVDGIELGSLSISGALTNDCTKNQTYGSGEITLSRPSPTQLNLDILLCQFESLQISVCQTCFPSQTYRRDAVNDTAH
jgi:hypothetical protein